MEESVSKIIETNDEKDVIKCLQDFNSKVSWNSGQNLIWIVFNNKNDYKKDHTIGAFVFLSINFWPTN